MSRTVIVVGAGIIGASIAWRAAQRGWRVTLIDAGAFAGESSWAGAGMLAPGGEFDAPGPWTTAAIESLAAYPQFVRDLRHPIDFRICGAIDLAAGARHDCPGIRSESTTWRGQPARYYPDDAVVDPRDVTAALRLALVQLGVEIREHEPVTAVDGHAVQTKRERLTADAIVLAAGAWSGEIATGLALPAVSPVRGHLLGYHAKPGMLEPILRRGHTYLLQRASGFLIAGATSENVGFDRSVDRAQSRLLAEQTEALLPELKTLPAPETWTGFRPASAEPVVRRVDGTPLWLAYGHYRNGILLAPWTADRIVTSIAETREG